MSVEKRKRIAKRFLSDDKPCAGVKEGRVHNLPDSYKVIKVDKFSFEKKK